MLLTPYVAPTSKTKERQIRENKRREKACLLHSYTYVICISIDVPMTIWKPRRAKSSSFVWLGLFFGCIYTLVSIILVHLLQRNINHRTDWHLTHSISGTLHGNSFQETQIYGGSVVTIAMGYTLPSYQLFVGSLRHSGFQGNIIIGLQGDAAKDIISYLLSQGCDIQYVSFGSCPSQKNPHKKCISSYTTADNSWLRFRLAVDWLESCDSCVGQVLYIDFFNSFFQENPFRKSSSASQSLFFFEEGISIMDNAAVYSTISNCKSFKWNVPLISLGIMLGEKDVLIAYLESLVREVRVWSKEKHCIGDQRASIVAAAHNYLFYDGKIQASILSGENEISLAVDENRWINSNEAFLSINGDKIPIIRHSFITANTSTTYVASSDVSLYHEINGQ